MFSFKKWAASASAACLLVSLSVAPLFSQAAAEQKQPQAKTKAEYDAYMLLYNEAAPAKKVELAAKFLTDHPETEFKMFVYQMQIDGYARLGNVDKVVETGEKFSSDFPQADNNTKKFVMQRMMTSYQQKNDFAKTVEYGDKLLAIDPKDLALAANPIQHPAGTASRRKKTRNQRTSPRLSTTPIAQKPRSKRSKSRHNRRSPMSSGRLRRTNCWQRSMRPLASST